MGGIFGALGSLANNGGRPNGTQLQPPSYMIAQQAARPSGLGNAAGFAAAGMAALITAGFLGSALHGLIINRKKFTEKGKDNQLVYSKNKLTNMFVGLFDNKNTESANASAALQAAPDVSPAQNTNNTKQMLQAKLSNLSPVLEDAVNRLGDNDSKDEAYKDLASILTDAIGNRVASDPMVESDLRRSSMTRARDGEKLSTAIRTDENARLTSNEAKNYVRDVLQYMQKRLGFNRLTINQTNIHNFRECLEDNLERNIKTLCTNDRAMATFKQGLEQLHDELKTARGAQFSAIATILDVFDQPSVAGDKLNLSSDTEGMVFGAAPGVDTTAPTIQKNEDGELDSGTVRQFFDHAMHEFRSDPECINAVAKSTLPSFGFSNAGIVDDAKKYVDDLKAGRVMENNIGAGPIQERIARFQVKANRDLFTVLAHRIERCELAASDAIAGGAARVDVLNTVADTARRPGDDITDGTIQNIENGATVTKTTSEGHTKDTAIAVGFDEWQAMLDTLKDKKLTDRQIIKLKRTLGEILYRARNAAVGRSVLDKLRSGGRVGSRDAQLKSTILRALVRDGSQDQHLNIHGLGAGNLNRHSMFSTTLMKGATRIEQRDMENTETPRAIFANAAWTEAEVIQLSNMCYGVERAEQAVQKDIKGMYDDVRQILGDAVDDNEFNSIKSTFDAILFKR